MIQIDHAISFIEVNAPALTRVTRTRDEIVIDCQAWPLAFSDKGKAYAAENNCPDLALSKLVDWLAANYPFPTRGDPVPRWRERVNALRSEKNPHVALKKYCAFMQQTEDLREQIFKSASDLDAEIEARVEEARGN